MQQASPPRLVEVDVLRGLAAMWVVLSHYLPHWNRYLGSTITIVPNPWGRYAVYLFFAISGFVVFMSLERCTTVLDFAVLRFSRLYPSYWVTLTLVTAVGAVIFHEPFWLGGFVVNATMFEDFFGFPRFDNVYWSLTVEMAFYLLAAALFALGLHRRTVALVIVWMVSSIIWVSIVHPTIVETRNWLPTIFNLDFAPYFGLGILFFDSTRNGWSTAGRWAMVLALATEFLLEGWTGLLVASIVATLFQLAIRGHLRFLVSRLTLWLGTISYALYLVHRNLGYHALIWLHAHHVGPEVAVPLTIAGALALAALVTRVIERPVSQRIRLSYDAWVAARRSSKTDLDTSAKTLAPKPRGGRIPDTIP